jgi:lipopolysaccharide transport system ATP-binding protein
MNDSTTQQLNEVAISVKNLSKSYKMYPSPKDLLKEKLHPFGKKYHKDFWALKDVSFEVKKGECVGIIGRNGSGKSTLLQILCGIMQPTEGEVKVNGMVSALLELGAGFHPQFTGRENVYLNGSIMGFTKEEMNDRFQAIAEFADIGEFIEQPVRAYSSGMFVRLAFAAAVSINPNILIVDEALAVGDVRFQKKCYDKMNSLKKAGTTIILVTHAHDTIKTFSSKAVLLDAGRTLHVGDPGEAVLKYMQLMFPEMAGQNGLPGDEGEFERGFSGEKISDVSLEQEAEQGYCLEIIPSKDDEAKSFGAGGAWINWVRIYGLGKPNLFHGGEKIRIEVSYSWDMEQIQSILAREKVESNLLTAVEFENKQGITIIVLATALVESKEIDIDPVKCSTCTLDYEVQLPLLAAGDYFLAFGIALGRQENLVPLRGYKNMAHLYCNPKRKWTFGLINWPVNIYKKDLSSSIIRRVK